MGNRRIQHPNDSRGFIPTNKYNNDHCTARKSASHTEEEKLLQDHPLGMKLERVEVKQSSTDFHSCPVMLPQTEGLRTPSAEVSKSSSTPGFEVSKRLSAHR